MERALIVVAAVIAAACAPDGPVSAPKAVIVAERTTPVTVHAPVQAKAETPPEAKPDPNKELAKRVQRALEGEHHIHAAAIDVTAHGGIVTLWGTAATADERQRASRVAYRVIGVTAVENKLAIASGS
jgi:osmotically-inducible protein OsmY